jgi:hypothetical protein
VFLSRDGYTPHQEETSAMTRPNSRAAAQRQERIAAQVAALRASTAAARAGGAAAATTPAPLTPQTESPPLRARRTARAAQAEAGAANDAAASQRSHQPAALPPRQPVPPQMALQRAVLGGEPDWAHQIASRLGPYGAAAADVAFGVSRAMVDQLGLIGVLTEVGRRCGPFDNSWRDMAFGHGIVVAGFAVNNIGKQPVTQARDMMQLLSQPVLDSQGQDRTARVADAFANIATTGEAHLNTTLGSRSGRKLGELRGHLVELLETPETAKALGDLVSDNPAQRAQGAQTLKNNETTFKLWALFNEFHHAPRRPHERDTLLNSFKDATVVLMDLSEEADPADAQALEAQTAARQLNGLTAPISAQRMNAVGEALAALARSEGLSIPVALSGFPHGEPGLVEHTMNRLLGGDDPLRMTMPLNTVTDLFLNPASITSPLPRMPDAQRLVRELLRIHPETRPEPAAA